MEDKTIPTWIYKDGESKLIDLKEGESIPKGWSDAPKKDKTPTTEK